VMKTLAAVTVVFLPGTFVAAVFSIRLFEWDMQTARVSRKLWVYVAVSVPLTLVTLTLWFAWMRLQTRKNLRRDSERGEALNQKINGLQQELREKAKDVQVKKRV